MEEVTQFLRQLAPCHVHALARAGWGRPPKDKEVWETGKLNRPSLGQVLLSGVQNTLHIETCIGVSFSLPKSSYLM
jgi:hypothetical protein